MIKREKIPDNKSSENVELEKTSPKKNDPTKKNADSKNNADSKKNAESKKNAKSKNGCPGKSSTENDILPETGIRNRPKRRAADEKMRTEFINRKNKN